MYLLYKTNAYWLSIALGTQKYFLMSIWAYVASWDFDRWQWEVANPFSLYSSCLFEIDIMNTNIIYHH